MKELILYFFQDKSNINPCVFLYENEVLKWIYLIDSDSCIPHEIFMSNLIQSWSIFRTKNHLDINDFYISSLCYKIQGLDNKKTCKYVQ